MTKVLRVPDYPRHIVKALERIDRYTEGMDEAACLKSDLVQDAVIRNIEILGEASNNTQRVAPEFAAKQNQIPWLVMYTCATVFHLATIRLTWRSSGRRSRMIFPACSRRFSA